MTSNLNLIEPSFSLAVVIPFLQLKLEFCAVTWDSYLQEPLLSLASRQLKMEFPAVTLDSFWERLTVSLSAAIPF